MSEYYDAEAGALVKCMVSDVLAVPEQSTLLICDGCDTTFATGPNSPRHRADTCPTCGGKAVRSKVLDKRSTVMSVDELRAEARRVYAAEFAAGRRR